jgi:hypothetical protein
MTIDELRGRVEEFLAAHDPATTERLEFLRARFVRGSAVRECSARGRRGSRAAVGKQRAHLEGDDA